LSLSSSQPGRPPCWVISLAFGLIGVAFSVRIRKNIKSKIEEKISFTNLTIEKSKEEK
jgi:hypothetical protein